MDLASSDSPVAVCATLLSMRAGGCVFPGGRPVRVSLTSRSVIGLPIISCGSASTLPFSRLDRHSFTFRPASSPSRPRRPFYPECLKPCRYLHDPPWLLPTGATVVGQVSDLPEKSAFPRRTIKMG